jgi:hypothetical protein
LVWPQLSELVRVAVEHPKPVLEVLEVLEVLLLRLLSHQTVLALLVVV